MTINQNLAEYNKTADAIAAHPNSMNVFKARLLKHFPDAQFHICPNNCGRHWKPGTFVEISLGLYAPGINWHGSAKTPEAAFRIMNNQLDIEIDLMASKIIAKATGNNPYDIERPRLWYNDDGTVKDEWK